GVPWPSGGGGGDDAGLTSQRRGGMLAPNAWLTVNGGLCMQCSSCQFENPPEMKFCGGCGQPLGSGQDFASSNPSSVRPLMMLTNPFEAVVLDQPNLVHGREIARLRPTQQAEVVSAENEFPFFYHVRLPDGRRGFVAKASLVPATPREPGTVPP